RTKYCAMSDTLFPAAPEILPTAPPSGAAEPTRRLFIKTYGCQMNVYDSERMADVLRPLGYATTDTPEGAHFVILNTCHIPEPPGRAASGSARTSRQTRSSTP